MTAALMRGLPAAVLAVLLASAAVNGQEHAAGAVGLARSRSLLQTWGKALDTSGSHDTPVTRVVNLLKEMSSTLQKEMSEDEELYDKLACWCNNNNYEKETSISAGDAKSAELSASIESLTARSEGLDTSIKELNSEAESDKGALAEATALREKQQKQFHGNELDTIQAIENLKAALEVLAKHHDTAPESTVAGGQIFKSERDSWESFLSLGSRDEPWSDGRGEHSLDDFMRRNGFDSSSDSQMSLMANKQTPQKFLRHDGASALEASRQAGWSTEDSSLVKRALKSAATFMQAHQGYYPAYHAQSGEIVGILKQLKEEMEGELAASQNREQAHAGSFTELRTAKSAQIKNGERMAEQKEDEFANTKNALAEAKEDLGQEQAALSEDQKFLANLKATCKEASVNFETRKAARMDEIKAVSQTISILMADTARDAMSGTFNFLQGSSEVHKSQKRSEAAQLLRKTALVRRDPRFSVLATSVELDSFAKVKKAIDGMIAMLKVQMDDEVKKTDYCKAELQENEMVTTKTEDHKADLEAKSAELSSNIQTLEESIAAAKAQVSQLQLDLQRASENRKVENMDFQKVVADQTVTIEVLKVALDRLATYYDKEESLIQSANQAHSKAGRQTPPVPQMEYKPSKSATGAMSLIEKLIVQSKTLRADTVKSESEAQAAYEQTVADTNGSVAALQQEIASKSKAKAGARKEKLQTESDVSDTVKELEGLSKYNSNLHADCDFVMKNFGSRQEARAQEIEALQQAKQILSGASLN